MVLDNLRFWRPARNLLAGAALALTAGCDGPTRPDNKPVWNATDFFRRNEYAVLDMRASDPDGDEVNISCSGAINKTGPAVLDSVKVTGGSTYTVTCNATARGQTAGAQTKTLNVAMPSIDDIAPVTLAEAAQATSALTARDCTNPVFSLGTPSSALYAPTLAGNTLTHKGADNDANGTGFTVPVKLACAEGNAADKIATANITPVADITLNLYDLDNNRITTPFSWKVGATTHNSNNGTIRFQAPASPLTIYEVENASTLPGTKFELPQNLYTGDDSVKVLFPKWTSDTMSVGTQDFEINARKQASNDPYYDSGFYAAVFDRGTYGQQGPRRRVVELQIVKKSSFNGSCLDMAQSTLDVWREYANERKTRFASTYDINVTEVDSPTLPNRQTLYLCQSTGTFNAILLGPRNEFTGSIAYIPSNAGSAAANIEGDVALMGSDGAEDPLCRVLSEFNDCGSTNSAPDATPYDMRMGLDHMRHFAMPAAIRADKEFTAGRTGFYFSRRNPQ